MFCSAPGRGFAFRFAFEIDERRYDKYDLFELLSEIGPCAPDGTYARLAFNCASRSTSPLDRANEIILEWSRLNDRKCIGRISTTVSAVIEFRAYYPWDWEGSWSSTEVAADAIETRVTVRGVSARAQNDICVTLTHSAVAASVPSEATEGAEHVLRFTMAPGEAVSFVATTGAPSGGNGETLLPNLSTEEVGRLLREADELYTKNRVSVDRHWAGLGASITNNLHWMVALKPDDGVRYTPAGRRWIFPKFGVGRDHWTVFCWDAFFNALELAVESPVLACETLWSVLDTQYENGNIPNWRGRFFGTRDRSQPPIGSFVALKLFLRFGDRSILEKSYPRLTRWSEWWLAPKRAGRRRDGNGNGLFEWGCDLDLLRPSPAHWENEAQPHQFAAWESGQDDLPNWDEAKWVAETETFDLESVDINSLLALDFDCLRRIATELGLHEEADVHRRRYESLAKAINERLWDEQRGMYVDRSWDGRFSSRMAASNFYPLVAGIAPADRAERMLETLVDEKKFWGDFVLPSISRDDPAFETQQYWRGTIWPPTNYLVYQGLKRYHFDETAASLAGKSVDLFLNSWRRHQVCRENFDSRTGEGGGQMHQSWGPLFALTGIEEFIDITPWDGLRIGSLAAIPTTTLDRIMVAGHEWRVTLATSGLQVFADGVEQLATSAPMVLRHLDIGEAELTARTHTKAEVTLRCMSMRGDVSLFLDGGEVRYQSSDVVITAGEHYICIRALG